MSDDSIDRDADWPENDPTRRSILRWGGVTGLSLSLPLSGATASAGGDARPPRPEIDGKSPRPGPEFLHSDPVIPPQLENRRGWKADPLLVSGADAYADGEYLYQDYVYDDNGARTTDEPLGALRGAKPHIHAASPPSGTVVYPTDETTYGYNAADLLEFRTRLVGKGVRYRITLQTMLEADAAATAIGIDTGGDRGTNDWGYGIGALGDLHLDYVLVTWGTGAELVDVAAGETRPVKSTVDVDRNQIEVTLPLDPGEDTWRHYAVVGLFDEEAEEFKQIRDEATETHPGGARDHANPPPIFNVAFRFDEPMEGGGLEPDVGDPYEADDITYDIETYGTGYWNEHAQAVALADRDISEFHADIDFGKIAAGVDESNVPETGHVNRLYGSRFDAEAISHAYDELPADSGEGIRTVTRAGDDETPTDILLNRIQPYYLYVPDGYDPEETHPVHIDLHGYTSNHNGTGISLPGMTEDLGENRDALILSPLARNTGNSYYNEGELDVFEALADVRARYNVDLDRITIGGYSMGGSGSLKLASEYPDVFANVHSVVGSDEVENADNLRHVPVVMWSGGLDDPDEYVDQAERMTELGYRHELSIFKGYGHFTHAFIDDWELARQFIDGEFEGLGDGTVERDPARVTYRRLPERDVPELALVKDGAYWVADIDVATDCDDGLVDARSGGSGESMPRVEEFSGEGLHAGEYSYEYEGLKWTGRKTTAETNALHLALECVTAVTIHVDAAHLDAIEPLELTVDSTHDAAITLRSKRGTETVSVPAGTTERTVEIASGKGKRKGKKNGGRNGDR